MLRLLCGAAALWAACASLSQAAGVLELHGDGVQIYRCVDNKAGGFAWTLEGPDANLIDSDGKVVGHHFAGPTWQDADGSSVVGKAVAAGTAHGAPAVPWLVLQATSHSGTGVFADVGYVVRSHTVGGVAPAAGCSGSADAGSESRVPYSATYTFFGTK
jgi:Protein of unknown function (DUF3455)